MTHPKPKRLLLISLIVIVFCSLAALTPLGARTAMMIRFQVAELSADDSNDEYDMDLGRFYVQNQKTNPQPETDAFPNLLRKKIPAGKRLHIRDSKLLFGGTILWL